MVFFFKQKTAYEMRISDWSSDVCSSDLALRPAQDDHGAEGRAAARNAAAATASAVGILRLLGAAARAACRKSAPAQIRSCRAKSRHPSALRDNDGCLDFARHERAGGSG